mgnify:CR=1 FL=1
MKVRDAQANKQNGISSCSYNAAIFKSLSGEREEEEEEEEEEEIIKLFIINCKFAK